MNFAYFTTFQLFFGGPWGRCKEKQGLMYPRPKPQLLPYVIDFCCHSKNQFESVYSYSRK